LGDDLLLLKELEEIGHGLEKACRTHHRRSHPRLHARGELALEPQRPCGRGHEDRHQHASTDQPPQDSRHRSQSPMMGSSDPRMATTSERWWPGVIQPMAESAVKLGARIFSRYGTAPRSGPPPMTYVPSSPRGDSTAT